MLSPLLLLLNPLDFPPVFTAHSRLAKVRGGGWFASRGAVEKWGHFIITSSQEGTKKARDGGASLALLYICYSAFRASTTASKPVPLLDLIRTWSPSLSSAFKAAIKASLSM